MFQILVCLYILSLYLTFKFEFSLNLKSLVKKGLKIFILKKKEFKFSFAYMLSYIVYPISFIHYFIFHSKNRIELE